MVAQTEVVEKENLMRIQYLLMGIMIIMVLFIGVGSAQMKRCEGFDKKVTYKILTDNIVTRDSKTRIFLQIYIEPKRFTVTSMVQLVERIKREYCEFDSIAVSIFDTEKREKFPDPLPQPLIDLQRKITPRGFYEYNKLANTGELSFQESRNERVYSIEIEFNPTGYCVTEEIYEASTNRAEPGPDGGGGEPISGVVERFGKEPDDGGHGRRQVGDAGVCGRGVDRDAGSQHDVG